MLASVRRSVVLVQLPIPPLGPDPIRGNVPLAAAYLKLYGEAHGLGSFYDIQILPAADANNLGDQALVLALGLRRPWMVGFTCYVWNIDRTLWIARQLKQRCPEVRIVLGGPEITADNAWVLQTEAYDFAVVGEGEQTFAQLLLGLVDDAVPPVPIAGLVVPPYDVARPPAFRTPMPDVNRLGSPYLGGILDAADEQMLLLETTRGCVFKCKFCYYPKSYDKQYYLAPENILANLRHAAQRGAREVFLLDPTLNQRRDFADLLRLLAQGNPERRFSYFGELRGEGITPETARLLREANFTEVEVGLQSIDAEAQKLMERKNNLRAFERGVRAMLTEGIRVKVDLIVGLPGDTVESVRRGFDYVHDGGLYSDVQVFNLSILPGTAFRNEAPELGLTFQPRPPYYLLRTPTLAREELFQLLHEAQELFGIEFDAQPPPVLHFDGDSFGQRVLHIDLDNGPCAVESSVCSQAFTVWLRSASPAAHAARIAGVLRDVLSANPFTTLQVVLDFGDDVSPADIVSQLTPAFLEQLAAVCHESPTYLDRYYALQPGRANGAKRLIALVPLRLRQQLPAEWIAMLGQRVTLAWRGTAASDDVHDWPPWEVAAGGREGMEPSLAPGLLP
jgi:radical SAM superfamily enzyme YgiQ (UPF0313 family)